MNTAMAQALAKAGLAVRVPSASTARCQEKLGWTDVAQAVAQAHQLAQKRVQRRVGVYLCTGCGRYHLSRCVCGPDTVACSTHWLAEQR